MDGNPLRFRLWLEFVDDHSIQALQKENWIGQAVGVPIKYTQLTLGFDFMAFNNALSTCGPKTKSLY